MRIDNARDPEQIRRMEEARNNGECYFCKLFKKPGEEKFLHVGRNWFVKKNDFPYDGAIHHYLIVSREHITKLSDVHQSAQSELFGVITYLEEILGLKGMSLVFRSGDMAYTGGTLDHLHGHLISSERKIGTGPNNPEDTVVAIVGFKRK